MNILSPINDCDREITKQAESPNLLETFKRKKSSLQQRLNDVDAVILALEKNPEINSLLELIAKAR